MKRPISIPPASKNDLSSGGDLAKRLAVLVGKPFALTRVTKTDGANLRKTVARVLEESGRLPTPAIDGEWRILPPKGKGIPRLLREFADTSIVTSASPHNLQVWNRNPSEPTPQLESRDGSVLRADDVRIILVRVDVTRHLVRCIIVATPDYLVSHFGRFGKETVKEQLIIPPAVRHQIELMNPPILFYPDELPHSYLLAKRIIQQTARIHDAPTAGTTIRLEAIRDLVRKQVVGRRIEPNATKSRGQQFEKIVAGALGYQITDADVLIGGYPDLRHQALEVKIQDAPTVDLGRYSPQFDEPVDGCAGFSTQSIRYLIGLTDPGTGICQGAILCPGKRLAEHFVYVGERSFKCQRTIPTAFFNRFDGQSVFNPKYP
jgi:hypothetical protein